MNYRRKPKNSWLIFLFLLVIMSLLWFFADIKNTNTIQAISDVEQEIAKPLPDNITVELLDSFTNKLNISDSDLSATQPFASQNRDSESEKTNNPVLNPNQSNVTQPSQ